MSRKEDWVLRQHLDQIKTGAAGEPPPIDPDAAPMPPQENMHNGLGRIEARLSELSEHVQTLVSTWRVQEIQAVEGRTALRERMDELAGEVERKIEAFRADVIDLRKQVDKMQPRVDDYWDSKQRVAGGWKALAIVGAIVTGIIGAIGAVAKVVSDWLNAPHHL